MTRVYSGLWVILCLFMWLSISSAQQPSATGGTVIVPHLIHFSGVLEDSSGHPLTGIAGITFSLYRDQEGGAALWLETQNVSLDTSGHYEVLLGAEHSEGVPMEFFSSGEARWLGIQVQGQRAEPARVLLVSVPYALKAADAATLDGLPPSAFMLAPALPATSSTQTNGNAAVAVANGSVPPPAPCSPITSDGTAKANQITKFTAPCNIERSKISDNGSTASVGELLSLPAKGTATASAGKNSQALNWTASVFNSVTSTAVAQSFRWQAEPINNDLATASGTLNLLYGQGTASPAETGLSISNKGIITYASGQTLPSVTGDETVTGNLTAMQLISTVTTGTAPLSVSSQTQVANLNASLLGGKRASAFATLGSNKFVGNQSVTGDISSSGNMSTTGSFTAGTITAGNFVGGAAAIVGNSSVTDGVQGATSSTLTGVYGLNNNDQIGFGVYGLANGQEGFGVGGVGIGTEGIGIAGAGGSSSLGSVGNSILGTAPIGVIGASTNGYAVVATSDNSNALLAENGTTNNNDTVVINNLGGGAPLFASGQGGSLFFDANGNLTVSGAIYGSSKHFRIDHPLDPANKYLDHASVESSELKNIYDGVALLDAAGSAIVRLPDWFEAVNGDFRYQLTPIGAPGPNLYIAQEISNNQFTIGGGQPGTKVSWQVTGIRHDPYANAHRMVVEEVKPADERGFYIHPELYGAPKERSLTWAHRVHIMNRAKQAPAQEKTALKQ